MARPHKETKVVHRKLGKEKAWGQAHVDSNKVEIDIRLTKYRKLLILVHEYLHIIEPLWSETKVRKRAGQIAKFLWRNNYRKADQ